MITPLFHFQQEGSKNYEAETELFDLGQSKILPSDDRGIAFYYTPLLATVTAVCQLRHNSNG